MEGDRPSTAAGVAGQAIAALGPQPVLLVIVLLNVLMLGVAGYYFVKLEEYRHTERREVLQMMRDCVPGRPQGSSLFDPRPAKEIAR